MFYSIILTMLIFFPCICSEKGIIMVPIAELVGQPMKSLYPYSDPIISYKKIPFCGANTNTTTGIICPRLHQMLFNEQVEILQEKEDELYIRVPNAFYVSHDKRKEHQEFWTLKKNIISYDALKKHNVIMQKFPEPISRINTYVKSTQSVVTLHQPFFDQTTKRYFSAGTRFVRCASKKTSKLVAVYTFNPITYQFSIIHIPKNLCILTTPQDKKECLNLFIRILKSWAHQPKSRVIPYVLGGCSFIQTYPAYQFSLTQAISHNNTKSNAYTYNNISSTQISGFDCSGIILRAAQMAGIPYFCKNTSAITATLKPLSNTDQLQNGDLILIPGHVIIVGDIQKNTIIEARGYDQGYGKVHEIPVKEQFQNIHTFQDLIDAYTTKKPLVRLNKSGNVVQTIPNYTLFKLASVWDDKHL